MLNYFDKLIKKIINSQKEFVIKNNDKGIITIKLEVIYSLINYVLKDYELFYDADIEVTDINNNNLKLFIVSNNSLSSLSENKIGIIKSKIRSSLENSGFTITSFVITSKEILEEG